MMANPSSNSIIKNSKLVVTIAGTAGFEAVIHKKPAITFTDVSFSQLSSVYRLKNIDDLPDLIQKALTEKHDYLKIKNYIHATNLDSFNFEVWPFILELFNKFYEGGYLRDKKLDKNEVINYFESHKEDYDIIASAFISKINDIQNLENSM